MPGLPEGIAKQILVLFLLTHWWMWNRIEIPLIYPPIGIIYTYIRMLASRLPGKTLRPQASERVLANLVRLYNNKVYILLNAQFS